ncbi:Hypothetical_protein [Hexamita inflata]|uniref:Hypothetical_protein n=1 Tax=Hexamita inflata TaxID=28002 RepID=A0AA86UTC1_9EUKA|nr:Hypothetical protein HINF_LOCUS10235 [Hexamita inflata]CAI9967149.1 Hypothetical protein HINF_LOCUS54794 [Hexamita inflata]
MISVQSHRQHSVFISKQKYQSSAEKRNQRVFEKLVLVYRSRLQEIFDLTEQQLLEVSACLADSYLNDRPQSYSSFVNQIMLELLENYNVIFVSQAELENL